MVLFPAPGSASSSTGTSLWTSSRMTTSTAFMLGLAPSKNLLLGVAIALGPVVSNRSCDMTVNGLSGLRGEYRVTGTLTWVPVKKHECFHLLTSADQPATSLVFRSLPGKGVKSGSL